MDRPVFTTQRVYSEDLDRLGRMLPHLWKSMPRESLPHCFADKFSLLLNYLEKDFRVKKVMENANGKVVGRKG